jgi:hypothetical protein
LNPLSILEAKFDEIDEMENERNLRENGKEGKWMGKLDK